MQFRTIWICAIVLAGPGPLRAQWDGGAMGIPFQIHSFASQGFLYSDHNNFLTTKSSSGSFALTDAGMNVQLRLTTKLRVGAQIYTWNVGDLNDWRPQLDWAYADYRWRDWFGVRGGKIKTALGLYNDTQDMQFLHTWALLPQSAYPMDLRDNYISHSGGDVYGNLRVGRWGSLNYTGYIGSNSNNTRGGFYLNASDAGTRILDLSGWTAGFDVRWSTAVPGLMIGASWMNRKVNLLSEYPPFRIPYTAETKPQRISAAYADWSAGAWHFSGEYRRNGARLAVYGLGPDQLLNISDHEVFGSVAYRFAEWLEVGGYNSRYYIDQPLGQVEGVPVSDHIFDQTVTARFDLESYWNLKVEGHFIEGFGDQAFPHGFYPRVNPNGIGPTTKLLVLRSGFNF